jgi:hypothetical protein
VHSESRYRFVSQKSCSDVPVFPRLNFKTRCPRPCAPLAHLAPLVVRRGIRDARCSEQVTLDVEISVAGIVNRHDCSLLRGFGRVREGKVSSTGRPSARQARGKLPEASFAAFPREFLSSESRRRTLDSWCAPSYSQRAEDCAPVRIVAKIMGVRLLDSPI